MRRTLLRGTCAIDDIVARTREESGAAMGGLAELIGPHCRTVQEIEPFPTLYGLDFRPGAPHGGSARGRLILGRAGNGA